LARSRADAFVPKLPVSQKSELWKRLAAALEQEYYELAAILRDELRMLPD
jgi:protein-arginine kinase activator protein McsA